MEHSKADTNKKISLTVDGIPVTVPAGTRILEAALEAGVRIPTLCDHKDLCKRAVCRICVVEGDGRGKLLAACANEVWEGAAIVTSNPRIMGIRKTIVELILANHPQECLSCVKNKKCELQNLAALFGIRSSVFESENADRRPAETSRLALVRDMDKCVKCGRCVEACQELQTVRAINSSNRSVRYEISTAYNQALSEGPCILCGRCASVCPVGAIFGYDESAELSKAMIGKEYVPIAQFAPAAIGALEKELDLPKGTITNGKMTSALKLLGFEKVLDAGFFAGLSANEAFDELLSRFKNGGKLPMLSSCSPAFGEFVSRFYPDLTPLLSSAKSPGENFASAVKDYFARNSGGEEAKKPLTVSIAPCLSKKIEGRRIEESSGGNFVITSSELAGMLRAAGIEPGKLEEHPFDSLDGISASGRHDSAAASAVNKVYEAYTGKISSPPVYKETGEGIGEAEIELNGEKRKFLEINGLARARGVMEEIREGKCAAAFIRIGACDSCV